MYYTWCISNYHNVLAVCLCKIISPPCEISSIGTKNTQKNENVGMQTAVYTDICHFCNQLSNLITQNVVRLLNSAHWLLLVTV